MRSVRSRPTFFHVRPASSDRYIPFPTDALLRGLPSPVPTQRMSGLGWKTATDPTACTGWSSKSASQVSPPFRDRQTPAVAAARYTTSGSASTASISVTRPLMPAGPMERARRPDRRSASTWAVAARADKQGGEEHEGAAHRDLLGSGFGVMAWIIDQRPDPRA